MYDSVTKVFRGPKSANMSCNGRVGSGVYFIQGKESGHIKIGYAVDVETRLKKLQWQSSEALELLAVQRAGEDGLRALEKALHAHFADDRFGGEWFYPSDRLLAYIEALPEFSEQYPNPVSDYFNPKETA